MLLKYYVHVATCSTSRYLVLEYIVHRVVSVTSFSEFHKPNKQLNSPLLSGTEGFAAGRCLLSFIKSHKTSRALTGDRAPRGSFLNQTPLSIMKGSPRSPRCRPSCRPDQSTGSLPALNSTTVSYKSKSRDPTWFQRRYPAMHSDA